MDFATFDPMVAMNDGKEAEDTFSTDELGKALAANVASGGAKRDGLARTALNIGKNMAIKKGLDAAFAKGAEAVAPSSAASIAGASTLPATGASLAEQALGGVGGGLASGSAVTGAGEAAMGAGGGSILGMSPGVASVALPVGAFLLASSLFKKIGKSPKSGRPGSTKDKRFGDE